MKNKVNEKNNKGFTLIELLVVVLIIGILAAIALPQYKKIILKTQLNSLKEIVESMNYSILRYYQVHSAFPASFSELDIEPPSGRYYGNNKFYEGKNGVYCAIDFYQLSCSQHALRYGTIINYSSKTWTINRICDVLNEDDTTTLRHKICQEETKKTSANANCRNGYCRYFY